MVSDLVQKVGWKNITLSLQSCISAFEHSWFMCVCILVRIHWTWNSRAVLLYLISSSHANFVTEEVQATGNPHSHCKYFCWRHARISKLHNIKSLYPRWRSMIFLSLCLSLSLAHTLANLHHPQWCKVSVCVSLCVRMCTCIDTTQIPPLSISVTHRT